MKKYYNHDEVHFLVISMAKRLILMDQGKIILDGSYADVVKQLNTPKRRVIHES